MKRSMAFAWAFPVVVLAWQVASAGMAEQAHRSQTAGIDVVTYPTAVKDVVVIEGALPAGDALAGAGNIAVPTLLGMMLDRGTKTLDKFAIADRLEEVGADISYEVGTQSLEVRAKCLTKDLPLVLGIIADELRKPALPSSEFAKVRQEFLGSLEASLQNTDTRAQQAFGAAIFPAGHPNHLHSSAEYMAAAKAASLDELKAFHSRFYGPAHMTLVVVGDVAPEVVRTEVSRAFTGWTGGQDYIRSAQVAPALAADDEKRWVPLADKPSVSVVWGQGTGLRYRDPDSLALRVGTAILGHGFTGRLMGVVRDRDGLTYDIGAGVTQDSLVDGAWAMYASFAPALLEQGIAATRVELQRWWSAGVTEAELADQKQGLIGGYYVGLSTSSAVASTLMSTLQRGYDLDWLDRYPEAVRALTLAEVNAAIRTHLDPQRMVLVEAGSVQPVKPP